MYCQSCETELSMESAFCSNCGAEVTTTSETREPSQPADGAVVGGLDENVAGALCYLFGFLTGLVFYLLEERNEFVRFHAVQSMLVFGGLLGLSIVFNVIILFLELIPGVGWVFAAGFGLLTAMFWLVAGPLALILWLVLMVKAYKGERYELPVVGSTASRYV